MPTYHEIVQNRFAPFDRYFKLFSSHPTGRACARILMALARASAWTGRRFDEKERDFVDPTKCCWSIRSRMHQVSDFIINELIMSLSCRDLVHVPIGVVPRSHRTDLSLLIPSHYSIRWRRERPNFFCIIITPVYKELSINLRVLYMFSDRQSKKDVTYH